MPADDPTVIRVLAIHAGDVLAALEANERRGAEFVLRVTPPFAGRMRARLHRAGGEGDYGSPRPVHIDPRDLLSTVPAFPTVDGTEDALRDAGEYSPETHREAHAERVESWRAECRERLDDSVVLDTEAGRRRVRVALLD